MNEQQALALRRWLAAIAADVLEGFVGPVNREDTPHHTVAGDDADPWDLQEEWRQAEPLLALLSDSHREVLVLRLQNGYGYTEIATRLGVPVGTVHSRLARARRNVRVAAEMAAAAGEATGPDAA